MTLTLNPPSHGPRHRSARQAGPWWGSCAALLGALALLIAGCSAGGVRSSAGGLPGPQASRLSLIVAQTRSQFPELSGGAIPFETRKQAGAPGTSDPEPALRGTGTRVESGLQSGPGERIDAALYLDKRTYTHGYMDVTRPGEPPQRWRIVAYDQLGTPRGTFDFTYALVNSEGQLRYLVLIGGRFEREGLEQQGFEGNLIEPGSGNDLARWRSAYKLDFGYQLPIVPPHALKVEEVSALIEELERDMGRLVRLRDAIAAQEGAIAALQDSQLPPEAVARRDQRQGEAQARLEAQQAELAALMQATEAGFVRYYDLRREISTAYAAYVKSNPYTWRDAKGKQEVYDRWKAVEFHHPRIDELVSTFLGFTTETAKVIDARAAAMTVISQHNNWSKDPSRIGAASPR